MPIIDAVRAWCDKASTGAISDSSTNSSGPTLQESIAAMQRHREKVKRFTARSAAALDRGRARRAARRALLPPVSIVNVGNLTPDQYRTRLPDEFVNKKVTFMDGFAFFQMPGKHLRLKKRHSACSHFDS